ATFQYPNEQRATTLWFHDHTLGMTRQNVYAGPAGFYLLRGGDADLEGGILPGHFPGPNAPSAGGAAGLNARAPIHEIPIAVQDRSFNADGSLFYPSSREFFDGYSGPYIPDTPVPPMWNPEFFGNMMVVNGQTWPYREVERRRYRLRFLNGCNSRFLVLKLVANRFDRDRHAPGDFPFWQIGSEGGFLPAPVELGALLVAPAERADVIVDFTNIPEGTAVYLVNDGPDEPFGGLPIEEEALADAESTMQVMRFDVVRRRGQDASLPPDQIVLPAITPLDHNQPARVVTLHEEEYAAAEIPVAALLGTESGPLAWGDAVTENPGLGETEVWEIRNFTEDAHPIHVHLVQFQVLDRQPMEGGAARPPEAWESGFKDTVVAYPGESTRIVARFDLPGRFVWHCHILEHEDNEMMRPYTVGE
ncbi:MAG TPA: multicopper oxidase domain-containing protein, partial [Vicinamibacterales bacterium]|nr:multicopper oxidase domain-containing protein [Vicinamibacterales bacterium]